MKSWVKQGMLVLSLGLVVGNALTRYGRTQQAADLQAAAQPSEINWIKDYATGAAEAKRSGKLLFVVFRCER